MGIDIYARPDGMTDAEQQLQYCGFRIDAGNVGYLREAYHGGPYATRALVPEAFAADECEATIPASTLRERLPQVEQTAIERAAAVYKEAATVDSPEVKAFRDFVEYCEAAEERTGKPCTIIASY